MAARRGFQKPETFHQYSSGSEHVQESGDLFGYSLASGDINGDSYDDLVIGVPGEGIAKSRRSRSSACYIWFANRSQ